MKQCRKNHICIKTRTAVVFVLKKRKKRVNGGFHHDVQLTEHPDVRGGRKATEVNRLWCHPFDGEFPFGG